MTAASIAYFAARRNTTSMAAQADEDRWWDQAKWASEQLARGDEFGIAVGIAALSHLAHTAAGSQAGEFVQAVLLPIIDTPGVNEVDPPTPQEAHLDQSSQEGTDGQR